MGIAIFFSEEKGAKGMAGSEGVNVYNIPLHVFLVTAAA
jgi:hypothetical protein